LILDPMFLHYLHLFSRTLTLPQRMTEERQRAKGVKRQMYETS